MTGRRLTRFVALFWATMVLLAYVAVRTRSLLPDGFLGWLRGGS